MIRLALCLLMLSASPLWAEPAAPTGPRILVMGDSFLASNRWFGGSVGQRLRKYLDADVLNMPVPGARIIYNLPITGALGMDIRQQYRKGDWDWIILNGGGNDLWLGCGCNKCDRKLDRLIRADGRAGEIPHLVNRLRGTGAEVIYLGYLTSPGLNSPIESCQDEGAVLDARLRVLADLMPNLTYISNADLVPEGDKSFHTWDRVHPSPKGSDEVARRVISVIKAAP